MCAPVGNVIIFSKEDIYKAFCHLIFLYKKISRCLRLVLVNAKAKTIIKSVNAVSKGTVHAVGNEYPALNRLLMGTWHMAVLVNQPEFPTSECKVVPDLTNTLT